MVSDVYNLHPYIMVRDEFRGKADEVRGRLAALVDEEATLAADLRASCPAALDAAGGRALTLDEEDAARAAGAGAADSARPAHAAHGPDSYAALREAHPSAEPEMLEHVREARGQWRINSLYQPLPSLLEEPSLL